MFTLMSSYGVEFPYPRSASFAIRKTIDKSEVLWIDK